MSPSMYEGEVERLAEILEKLVLKALKNHDHGGLFDHLGARRNPTVDPRENP